MIGKCSISHLQALIDCCLEPEVQGHGRTFARPLLLVAFRMENRVCAFCFFKPVLIYLNFGLKFVKFRFILELVS